MGEREMLKEEGRGKGYKERRKQTERVKEENWERTGDLTSKNETEKSDTRIRHGAAGMRSGWSGWGQNGQVL